MKYPDQVWKIMHGRSTTGTKKLNKQYAWQRITRLSVNLVCKLGTNRKPSINNYHK